MTVLRGQLEAALILLHLIDVNDDKQLRERATLYRDWVYVKMKENMEKAQSSASPELAAMIQRLYPKAYEEQVNANYAGVQKRRNEQNPLGRTTFLRPTQIDAIKAKEKLAWLVDFVFGEASANVHVAELFDVMTVERRYWKIRYSFRIDEEEPAQLPPFLSNALHAHVIRRFAEYWKIDLKRRERETLQHAMRLRL